MKLGDLSRNEVGTRLGRGEVCLRVGPFVTRLQVHWPDLIDHILFLYSDAPLDDPRGIVDFEVKLAPLGGLEGWLKPRMALYVDGAMTFAPFEAAIAMPMLEWCLNWCVFHRPHQYLILHSAVVERGGYAAIMPGMPGHGKSTLCTGLVHRGWRLLSDEVGMIQPHDGQLVPVPRPIGLKEKSIEVIRRFAPQAHVGQSWPGTRKGTVAHVRPPADSVERCDETARPAWLIFPRYVAGQPATLTRIAKADALLIAAQDAFNYSVLGPVGFETLANLVGACQCYQFAYGDLEEAVSVFAGLEPTDRA